MTRELNQANKKKPNPPKETKPDPSNTPSSGGTRAPEVVKQPKHEPTKIQPTNPKPEPVSTNPSTVSSNNGSSPASNAKFNMFGIGDPAKTPSNQEPKQVPKQGGNNADKFFADFNPPKKEAQTIPKKDDVPPPKVEQPKTKDEK